MTAKIFEDSAGEVWEVFEVRRSSQHSLGVSPGLEHGWLAFVGRDARRRLAPYPPEWETMSDASLEQLCSRARDVTSMLPLMPRRPAPPAAELPSAASPRASSPSASRSTASASTEDVENAVREFAHEARARGLQAVAAMMALKAMLREQFSHSPAAHDAHRVRRWFVEAYYFESRR